MKYAILEKQSITTRLKLALHGLGKWEGLRRNPSFGHTKAYVTDKSKHNSVGFFCYYNLWCPTTDTDMDKDTGYQERKFALLEIQGMDANNVAPSITWNYIFIFKFLYKVLAFFFTTFPY